MLNSLQAFDLIRTMTKPLGNGTSTPTGPGEPAGLRRLQPGRLLGGGDLRGPLRRPAHHRTVLQLRVVERKARPPVTRSLLSVPTPRSRLDAAALAPGTRPTAARSAALPSQRPFSRATLIEMIAGGRTPPTWRPPRSLLPLLWMLLKSPQAARRDCYDGLQDPAGEPQPQQRPRTATSTAPSRHSLPEQPDRHRRWHRLLQGDPGHPDGGRPRSFVRVLRSKNVIFVAILVALMVLLQVFESRRTTS